MTDVICDVYGCKNRKTNGKCRKRTVLIRDKGSGPHCRDYEEA